jgi:hypothetical protein
MQASDPPSETGGERPHKVDSKFDSFRTTGRHGLAGYTQQGMNALHILFKTSRFNLSKVGEHFANPCCFGEDLAAWLRGKLIERKIEGSQPYQEDWGWELPASLGPDSYYLCISGNSDGSSLNEDEGDWRIIVEKKRSVWQRLKGKGRIAPNDEMVRLLEEILSGDPSIRDVRREE